MTTRDEALAAPHAGALLLVQMDFLTGTQRLTTWSHSVDYFGYTWTGLGNILSVSLVSQTEELQYPAVDVQLNVANPSQLSLALGSVAQYRNRTITIWQALLDDDLQPAGEPEVIWAGLMDQVRFKTGTGEEDDGAAAVMRCEMAARDGRAPQTLRLTHAQHLARHPDDTFLSRIERMIGQPQMWVSVRFQRQE
jgi:hypothetical protein